MAFKKSCYNVLMALLILVSVASRASVADDAFENAKKTDGRYTAIEYPSEITASDLMQSLNMSASDKVLAGTPSAAVASDENELAALLDSLFIRVSDILDMRLYSIKVNIKVCLNPGELSDIYKRMFSAELGKQRSFYAHDSDTIYTSSDSFNREIIGHEMAHAIISHYFVIPAPVKVQEVLSMYVEYNLRHAEK
jgi:hypothetical protein